MMSVSEASDHFGDRLTRAIRARGPLCVGLDPYPKRIPALFGQPGPEAIERFSSAVIEAVQDEVAVVKPQIALFERWGPDGLAALSRVTRRAAEQGLLVILDAKRGDIADTGAGYADAYLGENAWLHADAVTVNPYMGLDTLEPWLGHARERGKGVVVLARTSNLGARDFQELDSGGRPVWLRLAERLGPIAERHCGAEGWSSLMFVVGATAPQAARDLREVAPTAPFLIPGFAAQGAGPADALAGAVVDPQGQTAGAIVNASRGVLYGPSDEPLATHEEAWREGVVTRARGLTAALQEAAKTMAGLSQITD